MLISLKGRQLDTIESLKDHPIALVSPGSITGHTAPIMLFSKHINSSLDDYFSEIIFSGQHHLSVIAVTKGNVEQMPGLAMEDPNTLLQQLETGQFVEVADAVADDTPAE